MGYAARVKLFYGVCYEHDSPDAIRCDNDFINDKRGEGSPPALLWSNEEHDGIRIVPYRYSDSVSFGVAIAESVVVGDDWKPLSLHESQRLVQGDWIARIIAYAERYGLAIDFRTKFGYWIVPYYG